MKHDPNKAMIINPRKIYRCGIENSGKYCVLPGLISEANNSNLTAGI